MSIPEEIEQLKIQLAQTTDEKVEAELLLEILRKYTSVSSIDGKPYVERLLQLAERMASDRLKGWGLYRLAQIKEVMIQYEESHQLNQQALALFERIKDMYGVASVYRHWGIIHSKQSNFQEALNFCMRALQITEETDEKQGIEGLYNNIGLLQYQLGNYTEAMKNHLKSLKVKEKKGDKWGMAFSYNNIAIIHDGQGNYTEGTKNHLLSLQIDEEIGNKRGMANTYNNLGVNQLHQGNYPEALKNHLLSLQIKEELEDKEGIAQSYRNIGNIYHHQANYPDALKNYLLSLKLFTETGRKHGISDAYDNVGTVHKNLGDYPEALKYYLQALHIRNETDDKLGIAFSYNNIACIECLQGNYHKAMEHYLQSLHINKEIGDKRAIASNYEGIGDIYIKQNNYVDAIKNKLLAMSIGEEINNRNTVKVSAISLSHAYKATYDFENALKYHEKYHQVESEILGEQAQKQLTNLSFMHNLEQKEKDLEIEQLRNVELKKERDRSENLLLNILPAEVAEELKEKGSADAKLFDDVTVLFTDFKDFTKVSERLAPQQLVDELHACFSAFDLIMAKYNIEKIKTVGDAYLAASGLPAGNPNHAEDLVKAAIEVRDFMLNRKRDSLAKVLPPEDDSAVKVLPFGEDLGGAGAAFEVRIGVHSGSVVAGIVGVKKFAYDIWGDTVNTAARMEQNSEAGKINISHTTYELVKDKFTCEYRGEIEAKNMGKLKMYFVS